MSYKFKAQRGIDSPLFSLAESDGNPIKLGDGTFGIVFEVIDQGGVSMALKLFYDTDDEIIRRHQDNEMDLGLYLNKTLPDDSASIKDALVLSFASVENILDCEEAMSLLSPLLERLGVKISGKGYIMDKYLCSLKDLAERGKASIDPTAQSVDRGYSQLGSLSVRDREAFVIAVARKLANALSILHKADLYHDDIKPANILVTKRTETLHFALSDLGFAMPNGGEIYGTGFASRPLGTRHYRSPEQIDYFDLCEVDINSNENQCILTTFDPKFVDSFSEKGDFVIFSKDANKTKYEILEIIYPDDESRGEVPTSITIDPRNIYIADDKRTQVSILKRHTLRTDVFGLGAIMFDLLSCGRSPERLYDLLRPFDRKHVDIERDLIRKYTQTVNSNATHPDTEAISNMFKNLRTNEYCSREIFSFVVRCMVSNASGTYLRPNMIFTTVGDRTSEKEIWNNILRDLSNLARPRNSDSSLDIKTAPIFAVHQPGANIPDTGLPSSKTNVLNLIESIRLEAENGRKLVRGYRFLYSIFTLIKGLEVDQEFCLFDLSPQNLEFAGPNQLKPLAPVYLGELEYQSVLENGTLVAYMRSAIKNPYFPLTWNYKIRNCSGDISISQNLSEAQQGIVIQDDIDSSGFSNNKQFIIKFQYLGPTPFWDKVEEGDYVLFEDYAGRYTVANIIKSLNPSTILIEFKKLIDHDSVIGEGRSFVILKKFKTLQVHFSAFAVYLSNLFFANESEAFVIPDSLYLYFESRTMGLSEPIELKLSKHRRNPFLLISNIFSWLLTESYLDGKPGANAIALLEDAMRELEESIRKRVGKKDDNRLHLLQEDVVNNTQWNNVEGFSGSNLEKSVFTMIKSSIKV